MGADGKVIRTSSFDLIYSWAEYWASVWMSSKHICYVDTSIKQYTMQIMSGTIKSTPFLG